MQPSNDNQDDDYNNQDSFKQQEEEKGTEDVPMAATLDKVFVPTIFENDSLEFSVSNPSLTSSHISYHVKGVDRQGPWEGQRRYSHFFQLREVLCSRWPGIVIPRIPPKKALVRLAIE